MARFDLFQNKKDRPRIRPDRTTLDWIIEFLTVGALLAGLGHALWTFPTLPATIGSTIDANGQPIPGDPSWTILLMPSLAVVLCTLLWFVQRYPWMANTLVVITPENAERQYRLVNRLLRSTGLVLAGTFGLISYETIQVAQGAQGLGPAWLALLLLEPIILPWYLIRSVQLD